MGEIKVEFYPLKKGEIEYEKSYQKLSLLWRCG